MDTFTILLVVLPVIAFLYAAAGHGGASSYIATLTLFGFAPTEVKSTSLILNIAVSLFAFIAFYRSCEFQWEMLLLLLIASVPCSYIGGRIMLDAHWYRLLLGILLLFPVVRFLGILPRMNFPVTYPTVIKLILIGATIGFVSGIIGIGGGIILSPLLLLLKWSDLKQTAALSAAFIFCNSIAGLSGAEISIRELNPDLLKLLPLTVAGGITGAYLGSRKLKAPALKGILTLVLLVASIKLIIG